MFFSHGMVYWLYHCMHITELVQGEYFSAMKENGFCIDQKLRLNRNSRVRIELGFVLKRGREDREYYNT